MAVPQPNSAERMRFEGEQDFVALRHFCGARGSRATNSTTTHAREPRASQFQHKWRRAHLLTTDGTQLRQNLMHDFACDIGQPLIAAVVKVSQAFVIKAQQMQDRRMQVMDVDLPFGGS